MRKGEDMKRGYRCDERLKVKTGGSKDLAQWSGGRGYLRSGKWTVDV
jgi:hypothetical protein